ncbi:hypothetical protein B0H17DRAFT_1130491 [Mycena rosella]|uniref:Uncharacterized protein n=1 Tax=Mycena rosella TaxID=1033263 RepID=A0AAD7GLZ3_MYCRO|nr:hypothetical protein B0H17DRAFT_1130491 [Mycena rosella]
MEIFSTICNLPFTRLEYVNVSGVFPLAHLSTVRAVYIAATFLERTVFPQIWDGCSTNLTHLALDAFQPAIQTACPAPMLLPRSAPIELESLRIITLDYIRDWMMHDLCPLDLSRLRVLSIGVHVELLRWQKFSPVLLTIEVLNVEIPWAYSAIDLSSLPNLMLLRILVPRPERWENALDAFSSIAVPNRIRKFIISRSFLDRTCCERLDSKLAQSPIHPLSILEIDMDTISGGLNTEHLEGYFPRMSSSNLVRSPVAFRRVWTHTWQFRSSAQLNTAEIGSRVSRAPADDDSNSNSNSNAPRGTWTGMRLSSVEVPISCGTCCGPSEVQILREQRDSTHEFREYLHAHCPPMYASSAEIWTSHSGVALSAGGFGIGYASQRPWVPDADIRLTIPLAEGMPEGALERAQVLFHQRG